MLYYQNHSYTSEIIRNKLISKNNDILLVGHFGIKKTRELIAQKYNGSTLKVKVESYMKEYNAYLALNMIKYESHKDL